MKLKLIISTFILCFACVVFANEEECETTEDSFASNLAKEVGIPNCYTNMNLMMAKRGRTEKLCDECRQDFESRYPDRINSLSKSEIQARVFKASIEDYKKNLISNLVSVVRMRGLPPTGNNFDKSIKACQAPKQADLIANCSSPAAKALLSNTELFNKMQEAAANEVAKLVSPNPDFTPIPILLKHEKPSCAFPEKDVLFLYSLATEKAFSPTLIETLSSLDFKRFNSTFDIFQQNFENSQINLAEVYEGMKSHPVLSTKIGSPQEFLTFIKNIPRPLNENSLHQALYTKEHGEKIDQSIASNCTESLNTFKEAICNEQFENGNINLESFDNLSKISSLKLDPSSDELAASPDLLQANIEILRLCKTSFPEKAKNISELLNGITPGMDEIFKSQNLEKFSQDKFVQDIGKTQELVCSPEGKKACEENSQSFACQIYKGYENSKKKGTLEYSLANSSNKEVNTLLRHMIGDSSSIAPQTKVVLVEAGILPQSDGTMVAQADIPERQPGYFSKPSTNSAPAPVQKTTIASQPARASRNSQNSSPRQELYNPGAYYENHLASQMPDFSDLLDESDKNLRNVQDEIMRRLSGLPNQRPTSSAQAKQIARDSLKSKGISNSSLESALASRMMATSPSATSNSIPTGSADMFDGERKEVASTSTETAAEKYKKDGMNRALADMYGARQSAGGAGASAGARANGRSPASGPGDAESEKPLSTVALSVPADPRVSLHQVFAEKLNKNDPEAQMLKVLVTSRKNFILQIGQVNFRVVFDKASQMNILLDSGDKDEAQRIRPQLEIFINRLRSI